MISKKEFITNYCKNSNVKEEWLMKLQKAIKCDCEEKDCQGWKMTQK